MVRIRFQRRGTKKAPHHRIVVTDQRRSQSSRVLEIVGFYDPSTHPEKVSVNESRVAYWVSTGAQVSDAVRQLLRRTKRVAAKSA